MFITTDPVSYIIPRMRLIVRVPVDLLVKNIVGVNLQFSPFKQGT